MLVAGLKRLGQLVGLVLAVALVLAVLGALLLHVPFRRSLSVTCYGLGGFFLLSGLLHGVRPPLRVDEEQGTPSLFGIPLTKGKLRNASLDERHDAISSSALFVVLGVTLIGVGGLIDPRNGLF